MNSTSSNSSTATHTTADSSTAGNLAADNNAALIADRFNLSPLVRITLLSLYVALTLPLPFLASATGAPVPASLLWAGIAIGFVLLWGVLSEQVVLDEQGIQVSYPKWVPFRRGWQLAWADITALKPRSTGQGGLSLLFFE